MGLLITVEPWRTDARTRTGASTYDGSFRIGSSSCEQGEGGDGMDGGREGTNHDTASLPLLPYFLSSMGKCHNGRISLSDKPSSLKVNRSPRRRWKMNLTYLRFSHTRHTILSAPEPASALRIACIGPSLDPPPHLPTHSLGHSHSPITADYKRVTVVRPSSIRPLVSVDHRSFEMSLEADAPCSFLCCQSPLASPD